MRARRNDAISDSARTPSPSVSPSPAPPRTHSEIAHDHEEVGQQERVRERDAGQRRVHRVGEQTEHAGDATDGHGEEGCEERIEDHERRRHVRRLQEVVKILRVAFDEEAAAANRAPKQPPSHGFRHVRDNRRKRVVLNPAALAEAFEVREDDLRIHGQRYGARDEQENVCVADHRHDEQQRHAHLEYAVEHEAKLYISDDEVGAETTEDAP